MKNQIAEARKRNTPTHAQVRGGAYIEASNLVAAEIARHRAKHDYFKAQRNQDFAAQQQAVIAALADVQILIAGLGVAA